MTHRTIYTDGSAHNATNSKGGYGLVIITDGIAKQYCGGCYFNTTSARMEIVAIIKGLSKCNPGDTVEVFSDNQYAVNALANKWVFRWASTNFAGKKNGDLWMLFLHQYKRLEKRVILTWIRGHDGTHYNEVADRLAKMGSEKLLQVKDKSKQIKPIMT
jgi:ribonuclease HI